MKYKTQEYIMPGEKMPRNRSRSIAGWIDDLRRDREDPEWANEALALIERMEEEINGLKSYKYDRREY